MSTVLLAVSSLFLAYFILLDIVYALLFAISFYESGVHMRRLALGGDDLVLQSPLTPPMSIILPAFNEEACIVASVDALRLVEYGELEIVVVDDGSTDGMLGTPDRGVRPGPLTGPTAQGAALPPHPRGLRVEESPEPGRGLQGERGLQGRRDERRGERRTLPPGLHHRRRRRPGEGRAAARRPPVPRAATRDGRGGRHRPHRQWVHRSRRPRHQAGRAAQPPRRSPGRGVHARLHRQPHGVEPPRRAVPHLGRLRCVPQGRPR